MKRIIANLLALALIAALCVIGVSAAEFVPSADVQPVTVGSATINGVEVAENAISVATANSEGVSEEVKAQLDTAREELAAGVENVSGDYKVGALVDISYDGELPAGAAVEVSVNVDFGDANVSAIYKNLTTGAWEDANCVYADGVATLTLYHFCPVAFLVEEGSVIITDPSVDAPQTGDDLSPVVIALGAVILSSAAFAVVASRKRHNA